MWFSKPKPEPKPPFFVWSEQDHSVGVAMFDEEHQRLTTMMAQIHESLQEEHDRLRALKLVEQLVQEARAHFTHEEDAMKEAHFPDLEAHAAEHTALIAQVENLLRQFTKGSMSAMIFPSFLRDWLIPHMQDYDRKYSATLRRQGLR
jgi:hemerythrin-like metal-binding protein